MDVQACLDILKARSETPHTHDGEDGCHTPCVEENATRSLNMKPIDDVAALEPEMESMTVRELLETFQVCQAKRVQVYQQFEKGFMEFMFTDELPAFSQGITMQFVSISNQVNAIERTLRSKATVPASMPSLLRHVQSEEKEKLLLTSAILLEKMRLQRATKADPEDASIPIFEKSIASMQATHTAIIERINDHLDALRYEMLDE
ncbi:Aste57867_18397 [Aphanomyces stellatus]|uniref:Aste57867_18397 protein n=1 Tax=Aphanomyces stellatus TaxID=120398 RepID=A0A485LDQ2_9STRA|nr:hypothetical protein As57867_018335 [Aphanomyces stellatus]VFT95133.1 Aste57867_18397 [Aphanomyces stellatus]